MAADNRLLGVFQLVGIPNAPRGVPQIEVTFDIDRNGILHVAAKDRATKNEQKITITSSSGLSKDEVDKLARDADAHKAEDEKRRQLIEARNQLDSMSIAPRRCSKSTGTRFRMRTQRTWKMPSPNRRKLWNPAASMR